MLATQVNSWRPLDEFDYSTLLATMESVPFTTYTTLPLFSKDSAEQAADFGLGAKS